MEPIRSLCVITSIILLLTGMGIPYLTPNSGWSILWGSTHLGLSWQMPLYGVAALFSLVACIYSAGYISFSRTFVEWHFWLSLGCVVWFAIGEVCIETAMRNETNSTLGVFGKAFAISFLATIPAFLATQLWFAVMLVRGLTRVRLG